MILVTGTQRSGTSMVAGCLFYMGVFMGHYFLRKDIFNPTGYFEDTEFGKIDENRWKGQITEEQWREQAKELIKEREDNPVYGFIEWGWKNPSSGLFIKDYVELCNPKVIYCKRNREDTLKSMNKMHWKDEGAERTIKDKEEAMKQIDKYLEINMEDLLENPALEIGKIIGYTEIKPIKSKINKAIDHILIKPTSLQEESYMNYV